MAVMTSITNNNTNEQHNARQGGGIDSPLKSESQSSSNGDKNCLIDEETRKKDRTLVLQALQKNPSLSKDNANGATQQNNYFDSFYLFSVLPETLVKYWTERELLMDRLVIDNDDCNNDNDKNGRRSKPRKPRWLDPFTVQTAIDCLGEFPIPKQNDALQQRLQQHMASLCFRTGMKIRMIPTVALDGAKSLGWLGKAGDVAECRKLGDYGICVMVTIREELPSCRSSFGLIACLERIREKQHAAYTICQFWRKYHGRFMSRKVKHPAVSRFMLSPSNVRPIERRRSNSPPRHHLMQRKGNNNARFNTPRQKMSRLNSNHSNHSEPGGRRSSAPPIAWDPEFSARKIWSAIRRDSNQGKNKQARDNNSNGSLSPRTSTKSKKGSNHSRFSSDFNANDNSTDTFAGDDDFDDGSGFVGWGGGGNGEKGLSARGLGLSSQLKQSARDSYKTMMRNQRNGVSCIVEKSYVLVDASRSHSDTLLASLKQLVDLERTETQTTIMLKDLKPEKDETTPPPPSPDDKEEDDEFNATMGLGFNSFNHGEDLAANVSDANANKQQPRSTPSRGKSHRSSTANAATGDGEISVASSKYSKTSKTSKKSKMRLKAMRNSAQRGRKAIFGTSSGGEYVLKVVPKPDSLKELIQRAIRKNLLFQSCTDEELSNIVDVFEKADSRAGKVILKQGEPGTTCYVLERGTIDVYIKDQHIKVMHAGTAFGEIALLYGSPRTATLRARYDCKLWVIDQKAFHFITTQKKRERLQRIMEFLKKVKIDDKFLGDVLKPSEIQTLATASKNITFKPGEAIVTKGERGDTFYLIESGSVEIFIDDECKKAVATMSDGGFFGERALLGGDEKNALRTATCIAKEPEGATCWFIGREDFNLSLGNLKDLLMISNQREHRNSMYESNGEPIVAGDGSRPSNFEIDDIEIKSLLGAGAFGNVHLVSYQKEIPGVPQDTLFALKCMSKKAIEEQQLDHRVESEYMVLLQVDNPFIVHFYGRSEDEENIYFLMETLMGGDIYQLLQENGQISEAWSRFYAGSVLYAFCHMHAKHIAYRDLKPENLAIDENGYIRVVDMGLAKKIPGGKTWTLCGTPDYMAPEIILNQGHDWAVDYWALGILLYEMVDGRAPFYAENQMKTYQMILSGTITIPSHFSKELGDLIRKLLVSSQEKRFGRTMGGPGAVMQHKWFDGLDWDALLEKEIEAPFAPAKAKMGLAALDDTSTEDGASDDDDDASDAGSSVSGLTTAEDDDVVTDLNLKNHDVDENKVSYAIGQRSNRHQQTMNDMIRKHKKMDRKTLMRSMVQTSSKGKMVHGGNFRNRSAPSIQSVQLGIQLLNLAATAKAAVKGEGESGNMVAFDSFTLLSCKTATMAEEFRVRERDNALLDGHVRYLDPFQVESVECLDQFPAPDSNEDENCLAPDALAPFCFPNGLRLRLLPKFVLEDGGAERLGWFGTGGDRYQLHVFTDASGSLSHGVAINTREVLSDITNISATNISDDTNINNKSKNKMELLDLISALRRCRRKAAAARTIARYWHAYRTKKRDKLSSHSNASPKFWEKKGKHHWQGLFSGKNGGAHNKHKVGSIPEEGELKSKISSSSTTAVIRQAREAYKLMTESQEDEVCIVEKSYILLGTRPEEQSLLFAAMQNMVDMERESNSKDRSQSSFIGQNRHMLLMLMQTKLCLSKDQSAFSLPDSELACIRQPRRMFEPDLPLGSFKQICLPLPLPHVSAHWGFATLLLRLGAKELLVVLKLLLLERSVVILGTNMEEVTTCSCAILDLLKPYQWASTFMPLLPPALIDFLSSPVPYITGMVAESSDHLLEMQNDYRVQEAIASDGLSVLNLDSGKLTTSDSDQVGERIRMFGTNTGIEFYATRLKELASNQASTLNSFQSFFTNGPSMKERITLHSTREKIKKHLHSLAGDLYHHPDAWPEYLEYNEFSKAHEFTPAMFLEPLRKKMMHQLKYQEMMAHTQLFVGFVENLKNESDERAERLKGDAAAFIVDFLNFKWPRYRNLHLS